MKTISLEQLLNTETIDDYKIFISKYKKSYLVGPKITKKLKLNSLKKRLFASSICEIKNYKAVSEKKAQILISRFYDIICENEILEISKGKITAKHKIIEIPGEIK